LGAAHDDFWAQPMTIFGRSPLIKPTWRNW
jgi:hypothetical protein